MVLYARPTRLEHEIHPKTVQLLKMYQSIKGLSGNGNGICITRYSDCYLYLLGAMNALNLLSGSGIDQRHCFFMDLDKITGMVLENSRVILEEK